MQYRASEVGKMKIEPAMISFLDNTTSSKMADQTDDFFEKENWNSVSDGHATPCIEVSYIVYVILLFLVGWRCNVLALKSFNTQRNLQYCSSQCL